MKSQYIILFIIAVGLIGGLVFYNAQNKQELKQPEVAQTVQIQPSSTPDDPVLANRYVDYSQEGFVKASSDNGKAVLFFAALKWCPSCQAADRDFKANFSQVPANVTVLKVDYDTAKDMKQKYAITMQDTFVQVDSSGKEITRWNSGGEGVKTLLTNLK